MRRLALLVLCFGAAGCYSKATARDGRFTFAYEAMVEHENFVKPIAPGGKLEVHAFANGTEDELAIVSATSSRPGVVAVRAVKGKSVVLEGRDPGVSEVRITARDASGAELTDEMFFHVARPSKHALSHACTEEANAVYVRGEEVIVHHALATADGRAVVGFDYAPVAVEPKGALELVAQPQAGGYYAFRAASAGPKITLRSRVDDGVLTMRVVDRKDLKSASLLHAERMLEGGSAYAVAVVSAGDGPVCNQTALTKARSLTPSVCRVTARIDDEPDDRDENRDQLARIDALAFGVCKLEVTLPELDGGRGVVLHGEVEVGREEYPGERGAAAVFRDGLVAWARPLATLAMAKDALALGFLGLYFLHRRRRARGPRC